MLGQRSTLCLTMGRPDHQVCHSLLGAVEELRVHQEVSNGTVRVSVHQGALTMHGHGRLREASVHKLAVTPSADPPARTERAWPASTQGTHACCHQAQRVSRLRSGTPGNPTWQVATGQDVQMGHARPMRKGMAMTHLDMESSCKLPSRQVCMPSEEGRLVHTHGRLLHDPLFKLDMTRPAACLVRTGWTWPTCT